VHLLRSAEAPFAFLRGGRYPFRVLAQSDKAGRLHDWLRAWLAKAPRARGSVRVAIDVDPISFL
jgi:primosomal protein N' (replication factor Y)